MAPPRKNRGRGRGRGPTPTSDRWKTAPPPASA